MVSRLRRVSPVFSRSQTSDEETVTREELSQLFTKELGNPGPHRSLKLRESRGD